MRILCNSLKPFERALDLVCAEHELVCLSPEELMLAWEQPDGDWWRRVLPEGWVPDVAVFWCPEYLPLPPHPWALPCPVALWVGDWYIDPEAMRQLAPHVDLLLVDAVGERALREAGVENVAECCPWTFDPQRDRPGFDAEPLWDVSFVGSLHDAIHVRRNRRLERVLRLDPAYRVRVDAGLYGEEYGEFLRRSRIGFNLSLTGDVNMRVFEIAASGSLLMLERGNAEIERWFTPGEECVLYGEDDLEDLVAYYLEHEDERRAIAEAGWRRVQAYSPAARMPGLLARLEALAAAPATRRTPTAAESAQVQVFQSLHMRIEHRPFAGLELLLEEAASAAPGLPALHVNRGVLYMTYAHSEPPEGTQSIVQGAVEELNAAVLADETDAAARLDQARMAVMLDAPAIAAKVLRKLLSELDAGTSVAKPDRLLLRSGLDDFHVAWLNASRLADPVPALTRLLRGEAAELLASLVDDPAERVGLLRRAIADKDGQVDTRRKLALELAGAGAIDAALDELEAALRTKPLLGALWQQHAGALLLAGRIADARAFADDRLTLAERMPRLATAAVRVDELVTRAEAPVLA